MERGANLHMAQLMLLPLTVSCFSKIQIGFTFWYRLTRVVPEKGPLNGCVCVCVYLEARAELAELEERPDTEPAVTAVFLEPDSGLCCLPATPLPDDGMERQLLVLAVLRAVSPPPSVF